MRFLNQQPFKISGKGISFAFDDEFVDRLLRKDPQATNDFFAFIYQLLDALRPQFKSANRGWRDENFDYLCNRFIDRLIRILNHPLESDIKNFNAICGKQLAYSIKDEYRFMTAKERDITREKAGNASFSLDEDSTCEVFDMISTEILTVPKRAGGESPLRPDASVYEIYSEHQKFLDSIERKDKIEEVEKILAAIEDDQDRQIIQLWMRRIPGKEIAGIVKMKEGTVASIINRTIQKLKKTFCKKVG